MKYYRWYIIPRFSSPQKSSNFVSVHIEADCNLFQSFKCHIRILALFKDYESFLFFCAFRLVISKSNIPF